ncbi:MAG TPA: 2-amino-4-hydroxy-6-hydroxymethyldihydropteridine diphosphokinase [Prolixibacteraceae bacterium]|nr:2-amino-4-hydroxy-6-hydroxymethyldihydropteridine diphosphokinase [Prolixibacteraceae bacterium]
MVKVYLLLGGNLGNKRKVFEETLRLIGERVGPITGKSHIYETEPWGFESDDLFWNQALELSVELSAREVLERCQQIENQIGRIRKAEQYDSRIMDIDILFYGNEIIESPGLEIPHPRISDRKFVLVPLNEIAPGLIHPVNHKSISQLLDECPDQLKVEKVESSC